MKKMLYVAKSESGVFVDGVWEARDGDNSLVTYDKDAAIKAARYDREHSDRKRSHHWVEGYAIEVNDGESAKECYSRLLDADDEVLLYGCDEYFKIGDDACFHVEFWGDCEQQTAPTLFAAQELADAQAAKHKGGDIIIRDDDNEEVARKCWDNDDGFGEW